MALFIYKTSIFDINCKEKVIFIVNFYAVATGLSKTKNFCAILFASLISIAITPLCFAKQSFLWYTRVVRKVRGYVRSWADYSHDTNETFQIKMTNVVLCTKKLCTGKTLSLGFKEIRFAIFLSLTSVSMATVTPVTNFSILLHFISTWRCIHVWNINKLANMRGP